MTVSNEINVFLDMSYPAGLLRRLLRHLVSSSVVELLEGLVAFSTLSSLITSTTLLTKAKFVRLWGRCEGG